MATLSQDTYIASGAPLTGLGGGSAQTSTFSSIVVRDSTITETLVSAYISTLIIDAEEAFISSISTLGIYLDGNLLTTASGPGAELLLNGIPIATTANISSLTDWSFDPAISTVNMNGNPIINSVGYTGTGTVSTLDLKAATASISSLVCDDILTTTLTVQSTLHVISSISSVITETNSLLVSSINGVVFPQIINTVSTFDTASISSATVSSINGVVFPQIINTVSTFDTASISSATVSSINGFEFPQVIDAVSSFEIASISSATISSINGFEFPQVIDAFSTFETASISSATISSINGSPYVPYTPGDSVANWANYPPVAPISNAGDITIVSDRGASVTTSAVNITARNGFSGVINMVADSGYLYNSGGYINLNSKGGSAVTGLYGRIDLLAEAGSALGVTTGGLINITATTGASLENATSAVKISAGSVNSYAGVIPVVGSVFGYNFMYGTLGANICAGLPSVVPNVPGTVYIYGATGIELNSDVYTTAMYPYWSGVTNPDDLTINGRTVNVGLGAYTAVVNMSTVGTIDFSLDSRSPSRIRNLTNIEGSTLTISGVSTINGVEYPPPAASVPADLTLSSLTINPTGGISTNYITIGPGINISTGATGLLYLNSGSGVYVTDGAFSGFLDVAALSSISSINDTPYPPPPSASITVSTLVVAENISTPELYVSSINGQEYLPGGISPDLLLSTLTMNTVGGISTNFMAVGTGGAYISTLEAGQIEIVSPTIVLISDGTGPGTLNAYALGAICTINGTQYPIPLSPDISVSTLIAATNVSTPELLVSSINGQEYIPGAVPPNLLLSTLTINGTGYVSTNTIRNGDIAIDMGYGVANALSLVYPTGTSGYVNILEQGYGPGVLNVGALTSVSSINGVVYPPPAFVSSYDIYVAPNGSDTTGTGSQQKPFLTIGQAIIYRATLSTSIECSIVLSSGTYTESFTLVENTFLVGFSTGETTQPCNIIGAVVLSSTAGQVGVSGLQLTGPATGSSDALNISGAGGTYSVYNCNITGTVGSPLSISQGTSFVTDCRIFGSASAIQGVVIGSAASVTMRNCIISQPSTNITSAISSAGTLTLLYCVIQNLNTASNGLQPLVQFGGSASKSIEISYCNMTYINTITDTGSGGGKCCIQFNNTANTYTAQITNCLLICEGASSGIGGAISCIQNTGTGVVNMKYGNLQAGPTAHSIPSTITHVPFIPVEPPSLNPNGSYESPLLSTVLTTGFQQIGQCFTTLDRPSRLWGTATTIFENSAPFADYNIEAFILVDSISSATTSVHLPNRINPGLPYTLSLNISQRTPIEPYGIYTTSLWARCTTTSASTVTVSHLDLFVLGNLA